jgi:hypothetical protein
VGLFFLLLLSELVGIFRCFFFSVEPRQFLLVWGFFFFFRLACLGSGKAQYLFSAAVVVFFFSFNLPC